MQMQGATPQHRYVISEASQTGQARREAKHLAQSFGLDAAAAERVAIAASELATNLVLHGGGGELLLQGLACGADNTQSMIEVLAIDRGRGMNDVDRCLRDGYSTAGTMGTGLGAVRRLANEFDIYSVSGEGTVVVARIGPTTENRYEPKARFGAVSVAIHGEIACGDTWRLAVEEDVTAAMVVDGLGHGVLAAEAAHSGAQAFETAPLQTPAEVLRRMHVAMAGSRGAAGACARRDGHGTLNYAGIGNIAGRLLRQQTSRGLVSHNGMLGTRMPRIQQFDYPLEPEAVLIMHSDGISARWDFDAHHQVLRLHPALIAGLIYRDHCRGRDDATVLVVAS